MSDSDSDGACWGEVLDLLDECSPDETVVDGELFRTAVEQSQLQHSTDTKHHQLAALLHEVSMDWLTPTLTEYELDDLGKLHSLFAGPAAAATLTQLGCVICRAAPDTQRTGGYVDTVD